MGGRKYKIDPFLSLAIKLSTPFLYRAIKHLIKDWVNAFNSPINQGFLRFVLGLKFKKYSLNPLTFSALGWTDSVPSTTASFPFETNVLADHPSDPIQEKFPVAFLLPTAAMRPFKYF